MDRVRYGSFLALVAATLLLVGCGGESPLLPTADGATGLGPATGNGGSGVSLVGSVRGLPAAGLRAFAASGTSDVVVTVLENPSITTTVGADGSFVLRGLPTGSFTLVFTQDGATLGTLAFPGVLPNQEITITVDLSSGEVVLVDEHRTGIGHGNIEIEGQVEQVLALDPAGESRFQIDGQLVVARPGQTAIRQGGEARTVNDVVVGVQVHVKGVWSEDETPAYVLAHEIIIQTDQQNDPGDGNGASTCMIQGGRVGSGIELEGNVASGNADLFMLDVDGGRASGPVEIGAGGATFKCSPSGGPNVPTPEQCRGRVTGGAKVHVSGTLAACSAAKAHVDAQKVTVQK